MSDEKSHRFLRDMIRIRIFEEAVSERFEKNDIPGFVHLYSGQEAVAVGACAAIGADDYITSTHRGHGHAIAKGLDTDRMMAELFGKETGYCNGKSGSMHIADVDQGMLGANGIVGAGPNLAVGAGISSQRSESDLVCLSFFGEGALAEGQVHEAMNMAGVMQLPVIFICENNLYGEMTPSTEQHQVESFEIRGEMYGIPSRQIDGMSVDAVHESVTEAVEHARGGNGSSLIICNTYRYHGHYEGDPETYRDKSEIDEWRERDPLTTLEKKLLEDDKLTQKDIEELYAAAEAEIEEAVEFARESPLPDPKTAYEDVYTEVL